MSMTNVQVTDLAVSAFRICAQMHEYFAYLYAVLLLYSLHSRIKDITVLV